MTRAGWLALASVALVAGVLLAAWIKLARDERRAQRTRSPADPKFTYTTARHYDYRQAIRARERAKRQADLKRKTADQRGLQLLRGGK